MPSTLTAPAHPADDARRSRWGDRVFGLGLVSLMTVCAVVIHGYHPFAEDGGIYAAGIKRLADPTLYPHAAGFVGMHPRFSLFTPIVAALARWTGWPVEAVLLLLHLGTVWLTLWATWMLAGRMASGKADRQERSSGAVLLMTAWISLPIAGTSLLMMDPYVTARSFSTPCTLLAMVGVLDAVCGAERLRGVVMCVAALAVAIVMHPLMGAYGAVCVLCLGLLLHAQSGRARWSVAVGFLVVAVVCATSVQLMSPAESPVVLRAELTRSYCFLANWQWFEWMGLLGPMILLGWAAYRMRESDRRGGRAMSEMAVIAGITAMVLALLFARVGASRYTVAWLQPLRVFQVVYLILTVVLGAAMGEWMLRGHLWRWIVAFAVIGAPMLLLSRSATPHGPHVEWPGHAALGNAWVEAFRWVRENTPKDSLFALDADYITARGEDAQGFRAIAERSALPDRTKDGGDAGSKPGLATEWERAVTAQTGLERATDGQRRQRLGPLGVGWVVLEQGSPTGFDCPYRNAGVKVCRMQ